MKTVINEIETGEILFRYEGNLSLEHQHCIVEIDGVYYRFEFTELVIKNGDAIKIINVSKLIEQTFKRPYPLPNI